MSAVGLPRFWNYYLSTSVPVLLICFTLRLPALNGPRLQVLFIIRICYTLRLPALNEPRLQVFFILLICYTLRLPVLNEPRLQVFFIIRICYAAFRMVEPQLAFCARIGNERGPSTISDKPSSSFFIAFRL